RYGCEDMLGVNDLKGDEVIVETEVDHEMERIKRTKRSKNSQKPTRNERDKNKSEETARNQKPDQPDTARNEVKSQNKVKGLKVTSSQSLKAYFEVLKIQGPMLQKRKS
ncbi:hypothetical protein Tco_1412996, partial [Tanacetum coccineum]